MRATLTESRITTQRNGALNSVTNPSEALTDDDQFFLGSADERCKEGASRMGALVQQAQRDNGFTLSTLGGMIDKDAPTASRAFDKENPHTVLRLIAGVILLDKTHTWLRGVCRLAGGEYVERPKLTKEQRYDLLMQTLERHGEIGKAFIRETFNGEE
jgi:hypothetical protein